MTIQPDLFSAPAEPPMLPFQLWCELHGRVAVERCEDFDREPGTDEQERKA